MIPFDDEADAIRIANDTPYGLSGSIWTRDGARAIRVARALETGVLSVNSNSSVRATTPFGGFKQSGFGRELGHAGARRLLGGQERVLLDGGMSDGTARRQGLRDHRRRRRHGPRGGDPVHARRARRSAPPTSTSARPRRRSRSARGAAFAIAVDVADEAQVAAMMAAAAERFGGIDVLYNNAGISPDDDASILDTSVEAWQRVQDVNTKGVFLCCKHGIPYLHGAAAAR